MESLKKHCFSVVIAHSVIAFWHHFHPWSTKNMDLETFPQLATPNHRKSQNCVQSMLQECPQIQSKSLKTDIWASVWPLGVPLDPRITKMVSQVLRKSSRRLITVLDTKSDALQQSTCQRLVAARRIHFQLSPSLQSTIHSLPICY